MTNPLQTEVAGLKRARQLIEDPKKWCKGATARNEYNDVRNAKERDAVKWCAVGACAEVNVSSRYLNDATYLLKATSIVSYNDDPNTSHADILAMFDRAIALAEAELGSGEKGALQ